MGFGELVEIVKMFEIFGEDEFIFKFKECWKYIGKDVVIIDLDDIVIGKVVFGIDVWMEN